MIVTSNRGPDEWLATFADPVRAQAAVDRFTSSAYDLVIEGESYRARLKPRLKAGRKPEKQAEQGTSRRCGAGVGNASATAGSHPSANRHIRSGDHLGGTDRDQLGRTTGDLLRRPSHRGRGRGGSSKRAQGRRHRQEEAKRGGGGECGRGRRAGQGTSAPGGRRNAGRGSAWREQGPVGGSDPQPKRSECEPSRTS